MSHNTKSIITLPLMAILAACAGQQLDERDVEYRDRFIRFERLCKERGGMVQIDQRIPKPIRNGVPDTGTRYSCVRR